MTDSTNTDASTASTDPVPAVSAAAPATATTVPTGFWVGFKADLTEAEQDVVTGLQNMANYVDNLYVADVQPVITKVIPDTIAALVPFVKQAAEETATELPLLFTGSWEAFVAALAPLLIATGLKAEAAGVAAAKTDVLAAVAAASAPPAPPPAAS